VSRLELLTANRLLLTLYLDNVLYFH